MLHKMRSTGQREPAMRKRRSKALVTLMSPRETGFLSVQHRQIEISWWGPPPEEAPTLVLLHEGLGCVGMWRDFPQQLAEATGLGVMAYSRVGYGASDPCALPRPLMYMQDEGTFTLPALLAAARVRQHILVGHSDGGSIALAYAGVEPSELLGVVTIAAHVFCEPETIAAIAAARVAWQTDDLYERLQRHHGENTDCAFRGWNETWLDPRFKHWTLTAYLPAIQVPVLALQGEDDEYGTTAQLDAIREGVGGPIETALLPGGHWSHRDHPEPTLARIAAFTRQLFNE